MTKLIRGCDLFCGAGGTSSGLWKACQKLNVKLELIAINHWNIAISTHQSNHPYARHLCEAVDTVDLILKDINRISAKDQTRYARNREIIRLAKSGMFHKDRETIWSQSRWGDFCR